MEAALWGLLGTIVGALASIGTTWLSGRSAAALQREASSFERHERMRAFQRETLLALQDAFHEAMRMTARIFVEDHKIYGETGTWGRSAISAELDEASRNANRRLSILIERVANDVLRNELNDVHFQSTRIVLATSLDEAASLQTDLSNRSTAALKQLGTVLRTLY